MKAIKANEAALQSRGRYRNEIRTHRLSIWETALRDTACTPYLHGARPPKKSEEVSGQSHRHEAARYLLRLHAIRHIDLVWTCRCRLADPFSDTWRRRRRRRYRRQSFQSLVMLTTSLPARLHDVFAGHSICVVQPELGICRCGR